MIEQSTLLSADTAAGKTGYRPSACACRWTAADVASISVDADVKISAFAYIGE